MILLINALGGHGAFDKRRQVEIVGLERGYLGWEAEGRELFPTPCL
jgi:hypothetical protein